MKIKWEYIVIIGLIIALLVQHSCQGDGETTITERKVPYTIEAQKGEFDKPTRQDELPSKGRDSVKYFDKIIYVQSKVNDSIVDLYKSAKTENEKMQVLLNGIRERDYISDYSDSLVDIQAKTKVEGTLKEAKLTYTLKPRTVQVTEKTILKTTSSKFALYAGASGQVTNSLGNPSIGVDLSAQINSKTIFTFGVNTNKDFTAGVKFRIFNLNK